MYEVLTREQRIFAGLRNGFFFFPLFSSLPFFFLLWESGISGERDN